MSLQKKKLIIVEIIGILLLNLLTNAEGQTVQKKMYPIRARLIDNKTHKNVPFAQVINKNMQWGIVSDTLGVFSFSANLHDTLYISAVGYFPLLIEVTDSLITQVRIPTIPLIEQVYQLDQVNIYSLGTYQQFKHRVLTSKLPEKKLQKLNEQLQKEIAMIPKHPLQEQASIPLGSPITALYMLLSKEGKGIKKYEEAKKLHQIFVMANAKYNREMVTRATGITGGLLDEFMMFSNPDMEFILHATEYEIYQKIYEDYDLFMKEYKRKGNLIKK